MKHIVITVTLITLLCGLSLWAGYAIRGVGNQVDCSRDNTVVIHKGVKR